MTYNFNHLPEGDIYDREPMQTVKREIGPERTFEVVHLVGLCNRRSRALRH